MPHRIRIEGQYGKLIARRAAFGLHWTAVAHAADAQLPDHEHAAAHVLFITAGGYRESARGQALELPSGSVQFQPVGARHGNLTGRFGGRVVAVELGPSFLDQLCEEGCMPGIGAVAAPDLCHHVDREVGVNVPGGAMILQSVLFDAMGRLSRTPSWAETPDVLKRVEERLRDLSSPPDLAELASLARCSRSQLVRACRRHWRQSPGERLRALRLERALALLRTSTHTIAEVAALCGFADQSHLTRVLRQNVGVTPGAIRRLDRR